MSSLPDERQREIILGMMAGDEISQEDRTEYMNVVAGALLVHLDRERIRHGLWKEYPAKDQVYQISVKADRVKRSLDQGLMMSDDQRDNAIEELYDIINYAIFGVRILEGNV